MVKVNVKELVLSLLAQQPQATAGEVARLAGVSRQAAHAHLRQLVSDGYIVAEGAGRGARYRLSEALREREGLTAHYRPKNLDEDQVWRELEPEIERLQPLSSEARVIIQYAFVELLNNAIEHAQAHDILVRLERMDNQLAFEIEDDGVGAFAKICSALGLPSELDAVVELSKGKLTTMPERHTGEGIFFCSKAADRFELESGALRWIVDNLVSDVGLAAAPARLGTRVRFESRADRTDTLQAVFAAYTDEFEFTRTRIAVRLLEYGTRLMSRSEARRLCARLEEFREVVLDFTGVEVVGQGFVDEVFRVFARAHPAVQLVPVNMSDVVRFMVERGLRTASQRPSSAS